MDPKVLPHGLQAHHDTWLALARIYKQLNAPVGVFGLLTLRASTAALENTAPGGTTYTALEKRYGRGKYSLCAPDIGCRTDTHSSRRAAS